MKKAHRWLWIAGSALLAAAPTQAEDAFRLLPEEITLHGQEAQHRVIAVPMHGDFAGPAVKVKLTSSDPAVVRVSPAGLLLAAGDGEAIVTATSAAGETARLPVRVEGCAQPEVWSFRHHVQPVLTKAGCNMGACHGALAGKGGFLLSLRGYDTEGDYFSITRSARGRRVETAAPAYSLLLTKPTAAAAHKGGKLIQPGSRDYRILAEWIAAGCAPPTAEDARLERIEVQPPLSLLQPGDEQPLLVLAHYDDGRVEDVTHWAKFTSSNEVVAAVDEKTGLVKVVGHGEGAITAWFDSQIVLARVTSPFPNDVPATVYATAPRRNFIDDLVLAQLARLNLKPSPRADDTDFLRRAYLDTIGRLPTPQEVRDFLSSSAHDKRDRVIDQLLQRPEFVDYWTYRWADLFMISGRLLRPDAVKAYYEWLRSAVAQDLPWDEMARQLVTASGSSLTNGATNFYAVNQEPETMAENLSQTFMALSINCAKCHNHPLEKWTNDQYYAFANLFARVRAKGWGGDSRNGDGARTLYVEPRGDLIQPRTGHAQPPAPLDGQGIDPNAPADRRGPLADWLTSPENPYFTRAIANRVWAAFFGLGIVDPVDDLRQSNPASNEPLLNALADYLVANDFQLKPLMRAILTSETYQRSSTTLPENAGETRYFSRCYPRRLIAEVLHDAVCDVTDIPSSFTRVLQADGSTQETKFYPKGTRAVQLYDSAVESYFLKTFGRNDRDIACECERSTQPSMVQALHLSNGHTLNAKLTAKEGRISKLLAEKKDPASRVDEAFLLCLSRHPTAAERAPLVALLKTTPEADQHAALEDLFWALMTSREFLFQH
ncbi:MAG: DUF1553 domain-containing protein [Verrucomicrobiales bacterium]|nr:DUF1553 domain-containing protein [Verrucomicrobiales bacterium]